MIFEIKIPIKNYEGDGIFYQSLFIECSYSPTQKEVIRALEFYHERDSRYNEYIGDWETCIEVVKNCKEFPFLERNCISRSTSVETKFGSHSLTMRKIHTYIVE